MEMKRRWNEYGFFHPGNRDPVADKEEVRIFGNQMEM